MRTRPLPVLPSVRATSCGAPPTALFHSSSLASQSCPWLVDAVSTDGRGADDLRAHRACEVRFVQRLGDTLRVVQRQVLRQSCGHLHLRAFPSALAHLLVALSFLRLHALLISFKWSPAPKLSPLAHHIRERQLLSCAHLVTTCRRRVNRAPPPKVRCRGLLCAPLSTSHHLCCTSPVSPVATFSRMASTSQEVNRETPALSSPVPVKTFEIAHDSAKATRVAWTNFRGSLLLVCRSTAHHALLHLVSFCATRALGGFSTSTTCLLALGTWHRLSMLHAHLCP